MYKFAKLFEFSDIGQVLVKRGQSENENEGWELRLYFTAYDHGVYVNCFAAYGYEDSDRGSKLCDETFDAITHENIHPFIVNTMKTLGLQADKESKGELAPELCEANAD